MQWNVAKKCDAHVATLSFRACSSQHKEAGSGLLSRRTVQSKEIVLVIAICAGEGTHILYHP